LCSFLSRVWSLFTFRFHNSRIFPKKVSLIFFRSNAAETFFLRE
jgi:hypothetical protein